MDEKEGSRDFRNRDRKRSREINMQLKSAYEKYALKKITLLILLRYFIQKICHAVYSSTMHKNQYCNFIIVGNL